MLWKKKRYRFACLLWSTLAIPAIAQDVDSVVSVATGAATATDNSSKASDADSEPVVTNVIDVAFDRYVDLKLLATAVEEADAATLTDLALQSAFGESVLERSHKAVTSKQLASLALKVALDNKDDKSLDRLLKLSEKLRDDDLKAKISMQRKLGSASRSAPAVMVAMDQISVDGLKDFKDYLSDIELAVRLGDQWKIDEIQKADLSALPEELRKKIADLIKAADVKLSKDGGELAKLVGISRECNRNQPPTTTGGYGPPPTMAGGYGPPPTTTGGYGPPPTTTGGYGPPPTTTVGYGPPPTTTGGYGPPPTATVGYGPPPTTIGGYIPPQQPNQPFVEGRFREEGSNLRNAVGATAQIAGAISQISQLSQLRGTSRGGDGGYGTPTTTTTGGYGTPTETTTGGYGTPTTTTTGSYGTPTTTTTGGYGTPTATTTGGYGTSTTTTTGGYGQSGQQAAYGPQAAGGGYGQTVLKYQRGPAYASGSLTGTFEQSGPGAWIERNCKGVHQFREVSRNSSILVLERTGAEAGQRYRIDLARNEIVDSTAPNISYKIVPAVAVPGVGGNGWQETGTTNSYVPSGAGVPPQQYDPRTTQPVPPTVIIPGPGGAEGRVERSTSR